jgi:hypothetical protein
MFLVKEIRTQRKRSVRKERDPCAKKRSKNRPTVQSGSGPEEEAGRREWTKKAVIGSKRTVVQFSGAKRASESEARLYRLLAHTNESVL